MIMFMIILVKMMITLILSFQVFLPFGVRQLLEKRINEKDVDVTLFDDAIKHVEQVLKNDPYVRFLQSKEYSDLLDKLH